MEDAFYAISFYFRIPAFVNRADQDTTKFLFPVGWPIDIEFTFSKKQPDYANVQQICEDGNFCYELKNEGSNPQTISETIDPANYQRGKWYVKNLIFKAKKDYEWITIQTKSDETRSPDCESYVLFDDFDVALVFSSHCIATCNNCSYTGGQKVVACNYLHTGTAPLTFSNMGNIQSASLIVYDMLGQFIWSTSASCPNGWENGDWEVNIPQSLNLAMAYYVAYVAFTNECGTCIASYEFLYQDHYTGSFNTCPCRMEGIIKPCCENIFEAEQYNITCQTGDPEYAAIQNLEVGVTSPFIVQNGTNAGFTAGNSIIFGPQFQSQAGGTFTAVVQPCSFNKRGIASNDSHYSKDEKTPESEMVGDYIQVYPNPSDGTFNVTTAYNDRETNMEVYNALGHCLLKETIAPNTTHTFKLQHSGVYHVVFRVGDYQEVKKVVVQ